MTRAQVLRIPRIQVTANLRTLNLQEKMLLVIKMMMTQMKVKAMKGIRKAVMVMTVKRMMVTLKTKMGRVTVMMKRAKMVMKMKLMSLTKILMEI